MTVSNQWKSTTLAEVAKWSSGGTPSSSNSSYYDGHIPWVVIGDLTEGRVDQTVKTISKSGLAASSAKVLPEGTLMLAMYGASIGRTGVMGTSMSTNQAIACGIVDENKILTKFLLFYLQSQKQNFISAGKGGAQPNISQGIVKNWPIDLPPLEEQERIVEILEDHLSRLDAALADVRQAKLKAARFRVSFLRSIFKGDETWATMKLKDVGKWQGGGTPSKSNSAYWTDGVIPWISPKDMGRSEIWTTQDLITADAVMNSTVNIVDPNSIVMVVRSGILERILPIAVTGMVSSMNQDMKALTVSSDLLPKFVFYSLLGFEQDILQRCRKTGTTVASINTEALMNYEIKVPTKVIQQSILEFVESQVSLLDATVPPINMIAKTGENLRRSLLQAAFSGQLTKEEVNV
jgi:type I restriction enzyme S subunit